MAKQWHQLERLDHKSLKKLQVDREKQAQNQKSEGEKKRYLIIAGSILFVVLAIAAFITVVMNRAAKREFLEKRLELNKSTVSDFGGGAFYRTVGDWEKVKKGMVFDQEMSFKTEKDGFLTVELQLKNQVKLASSSQMTIPLPTLDEKENKINREKVIVNQGEVTVAISLDGRDILEVESGRVVALGASGLYKMIYNSGKGSGEMVVKNGLVEVFTRTGESGAAPGKRVKVSGFYKVTFQQGTISNPTQASVIQYDWR